jgi:hypothetical protein
MDIGLLMLIKIKPIQHKMKNENIKEDLSNYSFFDSRIPKT